MQISHIGYNVIHISIMKFIIYKTLSKSCHVKRLPYTFMDNDHESFSVCLYKWLKFCFSLLSEDFYWSNIQFNLNNALKNQCLQFWESFRKNISTKYVKTKKRITFLEMLECHNGSHAKTGARIAERQEILQVSSLMDMSSIYTRTHYYY